MRAATVGALLLLLPVPVAVGAKVPPADELVITILFDNFTEDENLETGWGFAALLEASGHTILFDTGADGEILLRNMERLGVDAARIEAIVISHAHSDHTNGMAALLGLGIHPELYVLGAFPEGGVEAFAGSLVPIHAEPGQEIIPGIRTTGVVGGDAIPEQALILDTRDGPVVLTGCAHPGPIAMVSRAAELTGLPVHGIMGGLHLFQKPLEEVTPLIAQLQTGGVDLAGATHCTGSDAMAAFQESFGDGYVALGAGRVIRLPLS